MKNGNPKAMIVLRVEEQTAKRLALLCKRAMPERVKPFAADAAEAGAMQLALEDLGRALEEQGFAPR
jgi:hypothetical protein